MNEDFPLNTDATKFGPKCPQITIDPRLEDALIGRPLVNTPHDQPDVFDEFECLNLNISTPKKPFLGADWPVMIYINGGGGFSGSNSDWFCDGAGIVKASMKMSKPIVVAAINYRISALGHIGSEELKAVNGDRNGGNFVKTHISPFGGSSTSITIYGESFGGIEVEYQLHTSPTSLPPPFSRAIIQSQCLGAPLLSNPETIVTKSAVYQNVKEHLSVTTVQVLQEVPWQDLFEAFAASDPRAGLTHVPMIDGTLFPSDWQPAWAGNRTGRLIVGNTGAEGSALKESLITTLEGTADKTKVEDLLAAYQIIDSPPASLSAIKKNILTILEDILFYEPTQAFIQELQRRSTEVPKVWQYIFDQPSPFPGTFEGIPSHALDLAFLHGDSSIFESTPAGNENLALQTQVQALWAMFTNDEDLSWDKNTMFEIKTGQDEFNVDIATFLKQKRNGDNWAAFQGFTMSEKEAIVGLLLAHLGQMNGVE